MAELLCVAKSKFTNRRRGRRTPLTKRLVATQGDGPSFRGEQIVVLDVPCDPFTLSTTVTTGVISAATVVSQDMVPNFNEFKVLFGQYRIRSASMDIIPLNAASGVTLWAWDDDDFTTTGETYMESKTGFIKSNHSANEKSTFRTTWVARDTQDTELLGTQISTYNVAALKTFTNASTYGAPIVATPLWLIRPTLRIEFRGLQSN